MHLLIMSVGKNTFQIIKDTIMQWIKLDGIIHSTPPIGVVNI